MAQTMFAITVAMQLSRAQKRNPREIAYWHPAPNPNTPAVPLSEGFGSSGDRWDAVPTYVRFRPETGHIWIAGYSAGFQILEFTDSAGPTAPRAR